jgi:meckelin
MMIAGKQYTGSLYQCQSCPDPLMVMDASNVCTCPSGFTITGVTSVGAQSCIGSSQASSFLKLENAAQYVKYNDLGTTLLSSTLLHHYTQSATHCSFYRGPQDTKACEVLAHLCALQLYDDQSTACSTYQSITSARGTNYVSNVSNWVTGMPWLYFSGGSSACFATINTQSVTLKNYQLEYVLGSFAMNGTFLGYRPLNSLLSYCGRPGPLSSTGGGTNSNSKYQYFAAVTNDKYVCDLTSLYDTEHIFYELYLVGSTFIPVPVRIVNLRTGASSSKPNRLNPTNNLCDPGDVLVRRFYLFDLISGLSTGSTGLPSVIRYASSIILEVSQVKGAVRNVYSPVLTIQYTETALPTVGSAAATVNYTVEGRFTSNLDSFFTVLFGFFIGCIVLTGLLFLLRYVNWNTRNSRSVTTTVSSTGIGGLNSDVLIDLTVILMHSWVLVFFPFTVLVTWYGFVFFKLQSYPAILLPPMGNIYTPESPYYSFTIMLHVLTFFQLAYVFFLVRKQSNADIFFLDWEPAKTRTGQKNGNVSVWRTILVANEYSEMQTKRITDIKFTLLFMVLILIGLNYQFNATQQPNVLDLSRAPQNVLLRFAETTFWWLVFSMGQYLWKFLIYEVSFFISHFSFLIFDSSSHSLMHYLLFLIPFLNLCIT